VPATAAPACHPGWQPSAVKAPEQVMQTTSISTVRTALLWLSTRHFTCRMPHRESPGKSPGKRHSKHTSQHNPPLPVRVCSGWEVGSGGISTTCSRAPLPTTVTSPSICDCRSTCCPPSAAHCSISTAAAAHRQSMVPSMRPRNSSGHAGLRNQLHGTMPRHQGGASQWDGSTRASIRVRLPASQLADQISQFPQAAHPSPVRHPHINADCPHPACAPQQAGWQALPDHHHAHTCGKQPGAAESTDMDCPQQHSSPHHDCRGPTPLLPPPGPSCRLPGHHHHHWPPPRVQQQTPQHSAATPQQHGAKGPVQCLKGKTMMFGQCWMTGNFGVFHSFIQSFTPTPS